MDASGFVLKIAQTIINPTITLLFGAAILLFVWGIVEYIRGSDDSSQRQTGARHMLWGIIGIFIMISAVAILKAFTNSIYGNGGSQQNLPSSRQMLSYIDKDVV